MGMFSYHRGRGVPGFLYPVLILGAVLGNLYSPMSSRRLLLILAWSPSSLKHSQGPRRVRGFETFDGPLFGLVSAYSVWHAGFDFLGCGSRSVFCGCSRCVLISSVVAVSMTGFSIFWLRRPGIILLFAIALLVGCNILGKVYFPIFRCTCCGNFVDCVVAVNTYV